MSTLVIPFFRFPLRWLSLCLGVLWLGGVQAQVQPALPADSLAADSSAQKRVRIEYAEELSFFQKGDTALQKLKGDVQLLQDSTWFYCDSALFFEQENRFRAYGHVKVDMKDSIFLFSDRMVYDGNTRIAEVYDNITLTNQQGVLKTDKLIYLRNESYGYYLDGGTLTDDSTVLTSITGYYYPREKQAYFKDSVVLTHPDYTLETDTLGYNTETKVATFLTFTRINSQDGLIETTRGTYDTEARRVDLTERSTVKDSSYTLVADTLYYDEGTGQGEAFGRLQVQQEDSSMEIRGNYGRFNRRTDESLVTREAVAIQYFEDDTLYIFADTLFSLKQIRLVPKPPVRRDSLYLDSLLQDSLLIDSVGVDSLLRDSVLLDSLGITEALLDSLRQPPALAVPKGSTPGKNALTPEPAEKAPDQKTEPASSPPGKKVPAPESAEGDPLPQPQPLIPDSLRADSLVSDSPVADSLLSDSLVADSLKEELRFQDKDTVEVRVFLGYHNVRFFMQDMQGRADSMVYFYDDSTLTLYDDPVLWSEESQLTGDTIKVWMKNSQADSMWLGKSGFLVSQEDTVGFNQIKGREIRAKFRDNELYRLHVIGNAESIYFAQDTEDTVQVSYQGMNQALAQEMYLHFKDNNVTRIIFRSKPEGTFYPFYEVYGQENKLDGMQWRADERPERPALFPTDSLRLDSAMVDTAATDSLLMQPQEGEAPSEEEEAPAPTEEKPAAGVGLKEE